MLDNSHVVVDRDDVDAVRDALEQGELGGGSVHVARYEERLAAFFSVAHAVACSSGTAAITISLQAAGIGALSEVLIPATAPVMTPLGVLAAGARPVFVDVDPDVPFSPDLDDATALISGHTRAIVTVPMWGYAGGEPAVSAFAARHGLLHLEDAAQAHGSRIGGTLVGTIGHVGVFSTHSRKLMTTGEGGFCLTGDAALAGRTRAYRTFGVGESGYAEVLGANAKLAGVLAALGIVQLGRLADRVRRRRRVLAMWCEAIGGSPALSPLQPPPGVELNGYALVLRAATAQVRDRAEQLLHASGVVSDPLRYGYGPPYLRPALAEHERACPNAEAICTTVCTVPTHEGVLREVIADVASRLRRL